MFSAIRLCSQIVSALAIVACGFSAPSRADDTVPSRGAITPKTRLLVSSTGRVVKGNIVPHAGGYMVEMEAGSLFMPFDQVRLSATSLQDAYQKLRKSMPELTATHHVSLAKWCISNKQFSAAKTELLDALQMEPTRSDARQMLSRLDSLANPKPPPTSTTKPRGADGFHAREVESLNGLSRSSGQEFVTKVLPILKNKCGNANCHGGSSRQVPFRLMRTGGRDHRVYAERNLAEVLKYIKPQSPGGSELFSGFAPGHGGNSRTVFFGRAGVKQSETLRAWVYKVGRERRDDSSIGNHRIVATGPPTAKHAGATAIERSGSGTPESVTQSSGPGKQNDLNRKNSVSTRQAIEDSVRGEAQNDSFDPDVFNRMNRNRSQQRASKTTTDSKSTTPQKRGF